MRKELDFDFHGGILNRMPVPKDWYIQGLNDEKWTNTPYSPDVWKLAYDNMVHHELEERGTANRINEKEAIPDFPRTHAPIHTMESGSDEADMPSEKHKYSPLHHTQNFRQKPNEEKDRAKSNEIIPDLPSNLTI